MASRILGMGDVLTLIEQAEQAFDDEQKERMDAKLQGASSSRWRTSWSRCAVRRMGPIANLLGMLPGMGQMKDQLAELRRQPLRPGQGDHPVDDPGRARQPEDHQRLAPGPDRPGLRAPVSDVNQLVNRFFEPQDDEADGRHGRPARDAGHARDGCGKKAKQQQKAGQEATV